MKKTYICVTVISIILNSYFLYERFHEDTVSEPVQYEALSVKEYSEGQRFVLLNEGNPVSEESDSYLGIADFYGKVETIMKLDGHYEYLAYDRDNNELYATSYIDVMKITDKGYEKTEESVDMNTELCKTSVSFGKDTVQIRTRYLYDNDPRIGFTSDYGYNAEIKTASLGDFVPVSVAVK